MPCLPQRKHRRKPCRSGARPAPAAARTPGRGRHRRPGDRLHRGSLWRICPSEPDHGRVQPDPLAGRAGHALTGAGIAALYLRRRGRGAERRTGRPDRGRNPPACRDPEGLTHRPCDRPAAVRSIQHAGYPAGAEDADDHLYETDGLGVITLNRPEVMNALNRTMRAELLVDHRGRLRKRPCAGAHRRGARLLLGSGPFGPDRRACRSISRRRLRDEYEPLLRAHPRLPDSRPSRPSTGRRPGQGPISRSPAMW